MITRTIETTTLTIATVEIVDGKPEAVTKTITYYGKKKEKEISNLVGKGVILSTETTEHVYEMSIDDFVKNAKITN